MLARKSVLSFSERLVSQGSEEPSLAARGSVAKTPYFSWNIFCPAVIIWARQADQGTIQAGMVWRRSRQFRTNFGRVEGSVPDSRSGLKIRDLLDDIHK